MKENQLNISKILMNEKLNDMKDLIGNLREIQIDLKKQTNSMQKKFLKNSSKISKFLSTMNVYDENKIILKCGNLSIKNNKNDWKIVWGIISKEFKHLKCYKSIKVKKKISSNHH